MPLNSLATKVTPGGWLYSNLRKTHSLSFQHRFWALDSDTDLGIAYKILLTVPFKHEN